MKECVLIGPSRLLSRRRPVNEYMRKQESHAAEHIEYVLFYASFSLRLAMTDISNLLESNNNKFYTYGYTALFPLS